MTQRPQPPVAAGADRTVPADQPPSVDADDSGAAPADESARQAQDTVRSISRLEESN
jgi:hypothetical protein